MADVTGASLEPIYNRLNNAPTYHPLEADTFADWSMEAGDVVTVTRDSRSYESPVHSSTLIWKKQPQVTISSTGTQGRDAIAKVSARKFSGGGGGGGLRNAENTYYAIETSYNGMKSGLILASSSASLYVQDMYKNMKAGLDLTSSSAALYVNDRYKQMSSGLKLTSSSAALYVNNRYTQMSSGLKLTSSSAALYVNNRYTQMKSGLALTSSSAALYVRNSYTQMVAGLKATSTSATLYARSKENAAEIVARINESTGQSEILLNASKVYALGDVITGTVTADYINTKVESLATLNAKAINCNSITAGTNIYGPNGLSLYTNGLWNVTLSGPSNGVYTLKQTTLNGTETTIGTFSRATTLSGAWSNGSFTVTASPQGEILTTNISSDPENAERSGSLIYIPIVTPTGTSTGYRAWANFISKMTTHSNATDGLHRYNTGSATTLYIKLGDEYSSVGSHFWYYKNTNSSLTTYYS